MRLSDFDFDLPEELIALRPVRPRPASRLLVADGDALSDHHFADLPGLLHPGDRLVLNDTRVLPARLNGHRRRISDHGETFAHVEVTLLSVNGQGDWLVLARPVRRVQVGEQIIFSDDLSAEIRDKSPDGLILRFSLRGADFDAALSRLGVMPLPPYIAARRAADDRDRDDYQTVFAKKTGAVAAPTAGLHFDGRLLESLSAMGVTLSRLTLHVGTGTFLPVKTEDVTSHRMHAEWGKISGRTARNIAETKAAGGRVIPVGTTALRLLEAAARDTGAVTPWVGKTDIFIRPGFRFHVADALITNFHLPKSTLLILVSALMGRDRIRAIYAHAIARHYRFFSYGDSSLLIPPRV
ncbi:MAG: tRNA preQ1(34) S-adenosylmethionine ribosyltransferase-isomerase QueA [Rhodobacteraceae bacterium]|nr:tRNA preQ1(34) S-adenosylmethionine ribosyltransferase-isomerase QueA [Paracoccaceae bacterium]